MPLIAISHGTEALNIIISKVFKTKNVSFCRLFICARLISLHSDCALYGKYYAAQEQLKKSFVYDSNNS